MSNDSAGEGPVKRGVRPRAWERADGMKAMVDDERDAWISSGRADLVDDYTKPLYDQATVDRLLMALRTVKAGAGNAEFVYLTARDVLAEFGA